MCLHDVQSLASSHFIPIVEYSKKMNKRFGLCQSVSLRWFEYKYVHVISCLLAGVLSITNWKAERESHTIAPFAHA
ncbi:hypothetical protein GCM10007932_09100 [Vibrio penaeicida]|uniref:Uncharacterized protein n=1 Tax=Vibrio penaeicida TaxID=104609 RepID=A0AAV5NLU7_9VIBR|nr:hypothetical protein GCM10007932_09100 [Vibrio penaeicida]